jgi:hypothetical protein
MMSNLVKFRLLKILEQLDTICEKGVVVAERKEGIYQYDLFQIDDFYVELKRCILNNQLDELNTFGFDSEEIEKYIFDIAIN